MEFEKESLPPIAITADQLETETLRNLISEFVLREGTDYGATEVTMDQKIRQIERQISRGEVEIFFDPNTESVNLVRTN